MPRQVADGRVDQIAMFVSQLVLTRQADSRQSNHQHARFDCLPESTVTTALALLKAMCLFEKESHIRFHLRRFYQNILMAGQRLQALQFKLAVEHIHPRLVQIIGPIPHPRGEFQPGKSQRVKTTSQIKNCFRLADGSKQGIIEFLQHGQAFAG